jgi:anti-anti-sigma factor
MKLEARETNGEFTCLSLCGRLDLEGTEAIQTEFSAVTSAASRPVVVDMSDVSFLASLGMRMLVSTAKALRRKGLALVLLAPNEVVRDALEVTGLSQLLPVAESETAALSLLRGA